MVCTAITANREFEAKNVAAAVMAVVDGKEIWWSSGTPATKSPKGDAHRRASVKWFCTTCNFST